MLHRRNSKALSARLRAMSRPFGTWICMSTIAELVAILGPNGARKSTLMRRARPWGLVPTEGHVRFVGARSRPPVASTALGLFWWPEGRGIFAPMTGAENFGTWAPISSTQSANSTRRHTACSRGSPAVERTAPQSSVSSRWCEQQFLATAVARWPTRRFLLLSTAALGLAPRVVGKILEKLGDLNRRACPFFWSEQKAPLALNLSRRLSHSVVHCGPRIDPQSMSSSHYELRAASNRG